MYILRKIQEKDLGQFIELAFSAHAGITSLPKDKKTLEKKVHHSIDSFSKDVWAPQNELYLFVLENWETGKIVGISAIYSKTAVNSPSYYYRLSEIPPLSTDPKTPIQKLLTLISFQNGHSENASLFLHRDHRKEGLGRLLSLSRYLFIASNRKRFDDIITANLRGVIKSDESSPFWDSLGRKFINVDFETAQHMFQNDPTLITSILPKHPIYISMLTKAAQNAIRRPHKNSIPAMRLLLKLKFSLTNEVDIFDGGPKVSAHVDSVPIIKNSSVATVGYIEKGFITDSQVIVSNNSINFQAVYAHIKKGKSDSITLDAQAAKALGVDIGSTIRYSKLY